ncbi:hypothetical protein LOK49_LG06G00699 [Camellia lanceoleosa]|uniref:Uncharacterized protein n=1 Tax=Camellia lanceoleosa TaxID=1840588 RepID=A0ACC0HGE5_9ERIC|nr:hypothetical protein LOK49_LG06G00699 [Camellia lanceoleosa]
MQYQREREREEMQKREMMEIAMAMVGLWAVWLRPMMMRYAGEMMEVMGYAMYRIMRGRPSFELSTYLPLSTSFLDEFYY